MVFERLIQVLVFGCGYRRIADATCSATTLRRRRDQWIALGLAQRLHHLALATEATGLPLAAIPAGANRRDDGLLAPTLGVATTTMRAVLGQVPAPRSCIWTPATTTRLAGRCWPSERELAAQIAARGVPAPVQAGRRWPVERTHAWANQYGKLRWCIQRSRVVVAFWLALAMALIVLGRLIRRA